MNYYFITGTSRGIGKALAEELLKKGNNKVIGISRTSTISHENYKHVKLDLADITALLDFNFPTLENAENITLVNNSGTLGDMKPIGKMGNKSIADAYNINLTAPAILMNKFIAAFQENQANKVVANISSGAGKHAIDGWSVYCSSKAAIDMYSKVAERERELGKHDVKIMAIAPGIIETKMQEEIRSTEQKDFSRQQEFVDLKNNNELKTAQTTAQQLVEVLTTNQQKNVLVDLREIY